MIIKYLEEKILIRNDVQIWLQSVFQPIEREYPKLLIRVRFSAGLLEKPSEMMAFFV
jgi:hypothetical protein